MQVYNLLTFYFFLLKPLYVWKTFKQTASASYSVSLWVISHAIKRKENKKTPQEIPKSLNEGFSEYHSNFWAILENLANVNDCLFENRERLKKIKK